MTENDDDQKFLDEIAFKDRILFFIENTSRFVISLAFLTRLMKLTFKEMLKDFFFTSKKLRENVKRQSTLERLDREAFAPRSGSPSMDRRLCFSQNYAVFKKNTSKPVER